MSREAAGTLTPAQRKILRAAARTKGGCEVCLREICRRLELTEEETVEALHGLADAGLMRRADPQEVGAL